MGVVPGNFKKQHPPESVQFGGVLGFILDRVRVRGQVQFQAGVLLGQFGVLGFQLIQLYPLALEKLVYSLQLLLLIYQLLVHCVQDVVFRVDALLQILYNLLVNELVFQIVLL